MSMTFPSTIVILILLLLLYIVLSHREICLIVWQKTVFRNIDISLARLIICSIEVLFIKITMNLFLKYLDELIEIDINYKLSTFYYAKEHICYN